MDMEVKNIYNDKKIRIVLYFLPFKNSKEYKNKKYASYTSELSLADIAKLSFDNKDVNTLAEKIKEIPFNEDKSYRGAVLKIYKELVMFLYNNTRVWELNNGGNEFFYDEKINSIDTYLI